MTNSENNGYVKHLLSQINYWKRMAEVEKKRNARFKNEIIELRAELAKYVLSDMLKGENDDETK